MPLRPRILASVGNSLWFLASLQLRVPLPSRVVAKRCPTQQHVREPRRDRQAGTDRPTARRMHVVGFLKRARTGRSVGKVKPSSPARFKAAAGGTWRCGRA